jgi:hypothetical protein
MQGTLLALRGSLADTFLNWRFQILLAQPPKGSKPGLRYLNFLDLPKQRLVSHPLAAMPKSTDISNYQWDSLRRELKQSSVVPVLLQWRKDS